MGNTVPCLHLLNHQPSCAWSRHSQKAFQEWTFLLSSKGRVFLFFQRLTWLSILFQNRRNSSGVPWNGASVLYQVTDCWPEVFTRYPTAFQSDLVSESSPRWNTKAAQGPRRQEVFVNKPHHRNEGRKCSCGSSQACSLGCLIK